MSLLSALILPRLEKEFIALEPEIAQFLLSQVKVLAADVITWAEGKVNIDLNGDGKIADKDA